MAITRFGNCRTAPEANKVGFTRYCALSSTTQRPEQSEEAIAQALKKAEEKRTRKANKRAIAIPRQEHHN